MSFTRLSRGRRARGIPKPLLFQTLLKSEQIVFSASLLSAVIEEMTSELMFFKHDFICENPLALLNSPTLLRKKFK